MKIYTKTGDSGITSLIGGTRVPKYHIRIEAYGTVDELNSYIGLIRGGISDKSIQETLKEIQNELFVIGSHLAADPQKSKMQLPEIGGEAVERFEQAMDAMDNQLEPLKNFILPGGSMMVSFAHIARCVCRIAERLMVHLNEESPIEPILIQYINRLSDYLFVLARLLSKQENSPEYIWETRK
jgi:cob(I)alamin adenosyltransferase